MSARLVGFLPLLVAVLFAFSTIPSVNALSLPAAIPSLEVEAGGEATLKIPIFPSRSHSTMVTVSIDGDFKSYSSIDSNVILKTDVVNYTSFKIKIPSNYAGPSSFSQKLTFFEKSLSYASDPGKQYKMDVNLKINKPVAPVVQTTPANDTSATAQTSSQTNADTAEAGLSDDSEETKTNASATSSTGAVPNPSSDPATIQTNMTTATNLTSGTPNQANGSSTSSDQSQTNVSGNDTQSTGQTQVQNQPNIADTSPSVVVGSVEISSDNEPQKKQQVKRKLEKIAKKIRKLSERASSRQGRDSERHEFDLVRSDLKKVEIELGETRSNVSIVVDTLQISKVETLEIDNKEQRTETNETDDSGLITTPVNIQAPETVPDEEKKVEIQVAENLKLPDIEQEVVSEEVSDTTSGGEVVRKITKLKAYKYLEINVEGADKSSVQNAKIEFDVDKSWMSENGIDDPSLVRLNRYVSDWIELPTSLVSENGDSYTFSADSEGFSFFVITAAITADVTTPISVEVPEQTESFQDEDIVGGIVGTSKPQPLLVLNISWILIVGILGIVILFKYGDIKRAIVHGNSSVEIIKSLEKEKDKYTKMKEEVTKRYYKRIISEEEFKSLVKEYDDHMIRIDAEISQEKEKK